MTLKQVLMAAMAVAVIAAPAQARDQLKIVGSSTVFPYTQAVAEEFATKTGKPAPVVESTGTGGGMKIFCAGVGEAHPDITGASRAIKSSEVDLCKANGVTDITEALIGYDGLSVASSKAAGDLDLTKVQLFKALAADLILGADAQKVPNPYKRWNQIDPSLPNMEIRVFGPPPTSGTRDAFVELVMREGCKKLPGYEKFDKKGLKENCDRMRQDGLFIEAGENDNLIVQRLQQDKTALGIFGYSFLYENKDTLKAVKIAGVAPSEATIADGSYGISRPLFFYIKNAHRDVIPGMKEFIAEYMSEGAMGPGGYLSERGLVVLGDAKRKEVQDAVLSAKKM